MKPQTIVLVLCGCALHAAAAFGDSGNMPGQLLKYTRDGRLERPVNYREWVFLTSGFDMSYVAAAPMDQHTFDNVFVDGQAYKVFMATGTWPDKTTLVIEDRGAEGKGSINKSGNYQGSTVTGLEVHVKDEARFAGKWAFFAFKGAEPATLIPGSASCYACHAAHAAVDTTFVQFYPTLLIVAQSKGTLSPAYQKEPAAAERK
jgi:hypothetical protein